MSIRRPPSPAALRSEQFLDALLSALPSHGGRLPSLAELARAARVSLVTMSRAAHTLARQGRLHIVPGHGIWTHPPSNEAPRASLGGYARCPDSAALPRRSLSARLLAHIHEGRYPPGTALPSSRNLHQALGCSYRTLRKAIVELERLGVIEPHGRTYRVVRPTLRHAQSTVVLVAVGDPPSSPLGLSERDPLLFHELERHSASLGLRLNIVAVRQTDAAGHGGRALQKRVSASLAHEPTVGLIVRTGFLGMGEALLRDLAGSRLPTVVLDEYGDLSDKQVRAIGGAVRLTGPALPSACGHAAARHLLALGHQRIAYITCFPEDLWSINRYRGLVEVYESTGLSDAVHFQAAKVPNLGNPQGVHDELLQAPARLDQGLFTQGFAHRYRRYITRFARDEFQRIHLQRVLDRVLATPGVTAWVCENDVAAIQALDFLTAHGVRVPRDLSVMGFDNSLDSAHRGLTTYDFNTSGLAHALISHVVRPRLSRHRGKDMEPVRGNLLARATTGPCRGTPPRLVARSSPAVKAR